MRNNNFRGGASEYKINDVLGTKFQQFVNLIEQPKPLEQFLFKNVETDALRLPGSRYGPDDLHYDFTEFVEAASAAFRQIENPDYKKVEIASKYTGSVESIVDDLFKESSYSGYSEPKKTEFIFFQLPYQDDGNVKHLIPGFHLLPHAHFVYPDANRDPKEIELSNGLINAVKYLYHYIALLDLNTLDARSVVTLLKRDNLIFMRYVDDIANTLSMSGYFDKSAGFPAGSKDIVKQAVLRGLTGVAYQIVNKFKNSDAPAQSPPVNFTPDLNITNEDEFNKFVNILGTPYGVEFKNVGQLHATFKQLNDLYETGTNIGGLGLSQNEIAQYQINALLNPRYIIDNIEQYIDEKQYESLSQTGGNNSWKGNNSRKNNALGNSSMNNQRNNKTNKRQRGGVSWGDWFTGTKSNDNNNNNNDGTGSSYSNNNTGSSYSNNNDNGSGILDVPPKSTGTSGLGVPKRGEGRLSLPFLYGPRSRDGKRYLVTSDVQGDIPNNAHIVNIDNVHLIEEDDAGSPLDSGIISEILNIGETPNYNPTRVILLTILYDMIHNRVNFQAYGNSGSSVRTRLEDNIRTALRNYNVLFSRLQKIPKSNYSTAFADLKNAFLTEFTLDSYKQFEIEKNSGNLALATGPTTSPNKSNLQDEEVYNFYNTYILNGSEDQRKFYNRFFNLVRLNATSAGSPQSDVNIAEARDKSKAELANYRLNVRKDTGFTRLTGGQRGGAFGDIVFVSTLPSYPADGSVKNIWLDRNTVVPVQQLTADNVEAIRNIARAVYNSPREQSVVQIYGHPIDLIPVAQRVASVGLPNLNYQTYFKNILRSAVAASEKPVLPPEWVDHEDKLAEHILRQASKWERVGNDFVLKKEDGSIEQTVPQDSCAFINVSTRECLDFFGSCLPSNSATLSDACKKLYTFDFSVNPPISQLKDEIVKIDPVVAYLILKQFRFGSVLAEESNDPFYGFRRYKVQSVGSWIRELISNSDRCLTQQPSTNPCKPRTLREELGDDAADKILDMIKNKTNMPFFTYLDVLVQWVNANPQVLNPEEAKHIQVIKNRWPNINESFKTYDYLNPYKPADVKLREMSCDFERWKFSILNGTSGLNGATLISNLSTVSSNINMPFARSGFVSPIPFANTIPMIGGHFGTQNELANLNNQYGYEMFRQIYKNLVDTMNTMPGDKKITLSVNTHNKCKEKLESFARAEEELRKCIARLVERNKLYQASRGYIDAYNIPDENFAAVLEKHSNLFNVHSAYNKKAINLIDIFQTISKAILSKMEETRPGVERPLTMGYHNASSIY
ncbi:hypothetical protein QLL95_gp1024 [Cotonvirus japonicus]|uniref:Uncharacterized protein n=1 Tax=Cotonvirus japonicus TaxID=2811091 RepID=A0ABM7NSH3_9VIRU|nr:hypothetical protein QLL95_gp1024 [Cotonvirus japonicus]BCS83099.1 hypothetical protein [Cotonvirus japonicus]